MDSLVLNEPHRKNTPVVHSLARVEGIFTNTLKKFYNMFDDEFAVVRYILIFQYRLLYYCICNNFHSTLYLYGQIRLYNRKMKVNKKNFLNN